MSTGRIMGSLAALSSAVLLAGAAAAAEKLSAIACLQRSNTLTKGFLEHFQKPAGKVTGGALKIDFIGGQEVVPPRGAYRALQRGQFDLMHCPTSYYAGSLPEAWAMLASNQPPETLRENGGFALLDEIFQKRVGAKLLAWADWHTSYHLYLVPKPEMEGGVPDLSGLKLRASPTYRPLIEALGGSTINIKSSEIYTAMKRGIIQGFGFTDNSVPQLGVKEIIRYRIMPSFYHTNTVVTIDLDKYDALSKAEKDGLHKLSLHYEEKAPAFVAQAVQKEVDELHKAGVKDIEVPGRSKYLSIAYEALWSALAEKDSTYVSELKAKLYKAE